MQEELKNAEMFSVRTKAKLELLKPTFTGQT